METQKPVQFNGTPGQYFIVTIVSVICAYVPIFGWAFMLNYVAGWVAENSLFNGRKVQYRATYGESLAFIFINTLLLLVTFGIYTFWFTPKMYRYIADHIVYLDEARAAAQVPAVPAQPTAPVDPTNTATPPVAS